MNEFSSAIIGVGTEVYDDDDTPVWPEDALPPSDPSAAAARSRILAIVDTLEGFFGTVRACLHPVVPETIVTASLTLAELRAAVQSRENFVEPSEEEEEEEEEEETSELCDELARTKERLREITRENEVREEALRGELDEAMRRIPTEPTVTRREYEDVVEQLRRAQSQRDEASRTAAEAHDRLREAEAQLEDDARLAELTAERLALAERTAAEATENEETARNEANELTDRIATLENEVESYRQQQQQQQQQWQNPSAELTAPQQQKSDGNCCDENSAVVERLRAENGALKKQLERQATSLAELKAKSAEALKSAQDELAAQQRKATESKLRDETRSVARVRAAKLVQTTRERVQRIQERTRCIAAGLDAADEERLRYRLTPADLFPMPLMGSVPDEVYIQLLKRWCAEKHSAELRDELALRPSTEEFAALKLKEAEAMRRAEAAELENATRRVQMRAQETTIRDSRRLSRSPLFAMTECPPVARRTHIVHESLRVAQKPIPAGSDGADMSSGAAAPVNAQVMKVQRDAAHTAVKCLSSEPAMQAAEKAPVVVEEAPQKETHATPQPTAVKRLSSESEEPIFGRQRAHPAVKPAIAEHVVECAQATTVKRLSTDTGATSATVAEAKEDVAATAKQGMGWMRASAPHNAAAAAAMPPKPEKPAALSQPQERTGLLAEQRKPTEQPSQETQPQPTSEQPRHHQARGSQETKQSFSGDEIASRAWLESIGVVVPQGDFWKALGDGVTILAVLDKFKPGTVAWANVAQPKPPRELHLFQRIANCTIAADAFHKLIPSLKAVEGRDMVENKKTLEVVISELRKWSTTIMQ